MLKRFEIDLVAQRPTAQYLQLTVEKITNFPPFNSSIIFLIFYLYRKLITLFKMRNEIFSNISKIIERDSKTTTYKFALLRGVIDIIQDNSPYIYYSNDRAYFPLGLLIEKWLIYYYPIMEVEYNIPQINGKSKLAFEMQFKKFITEYRDIGGLSAFYNDLRNKGLPPKFIPAFFDLAKKMKNTITLMPMKHIGRSISDEYYSIFQFEPKSKGKKPDTIDIEYLTTNFGIFSIPIEYYDAFRILGSFINGQDSILFKWAEFSVNASGKNLSFEKVIGEVLKNPITERDIKESKRIFESILKKQGKVYCVWTGDPILKYQVDHLIPFSIWKNNDLWNLLPSKAVINNQKRDKIPSTHLIEKRKDLIIHYWELLNKNQFERFQKEIQISLLGNNSNTNWQEKAFAHLQNSCRYLINNRGYIEWNI